MKNALRFSDFVHFFERSDIVAIFHALSREVVFVSVADLVGIRSSLSHSSFGGINDETMSYLIQKKFIVSRDADEKEDLEVLQSSILQHPCIETLYLLLTNSCNFACTYYCFFEGSYSGPKEKTKNMTKEMAITAVNKFAGFFKKAYEYDDFYPYEPSIVFYGGESFINVDVFFATVEEVATLKKSGVLPKNLAMNINTNGSLITQEIATFCTKHKIEVDVSLEGYQSAHDACCVWRGRNNGGTFDDVMRGVAILKDVGAKTCISCTVNENNVEEFSIGFWMVRE